MAVVLFVVGMTTLTSCTKDNSDRIIGKWKFEKEFPSDVLTLGVTSDDFSEMKNLQNAMFAMADTVPTEIDLINRINVANKH